MANSDKTIDFLKMVAAHPKGMIRYDDVKDTIAEDEYCDRVLLLYEQGLLDIHLSIVIRSIVPSARVMITSSGRDYLERLEQAAQQHADEQAQQDAKEHKAERLRVKDARRGWWQFFLGILLGWVLGGFTFKEFLALFPWFH